MTKEYILVTGSAGFIGFHLVCELLKRGFNVIGIDNINNYYDKRLKEDRLKLINEVYEEKKIVSEIGYHFCEGDISSQLFLNTIGDQYNLKIVIHLAAQAGVRYSLINPSAYVQSNLVGFANILELCRNYSIEHLVYASTSSVYGSNTKLPFSENDSANHQIQFYAATKRANELMAHSYSSLYKLPTTGLRFFTVYGPWGRPDMAPFIFAKSIQENVPIKIFNNGIHTRDFTFVDDIVEGIIKVSNNYASANSNWDSNLPDPATSSAPYRIYNIGNSHPVKLLDFISEIEDAFGKKAILQNMPIQPGDLIDTHADVSNFEKATGYKPSTSVKIGVKKFVKWYKEYYKI